MKVYMVFINNGFGGIKYFQNRKNADEFAKPVNEEVVEEYATAHEWHELEYSDPIKEDV